MADTIGALTLPVPETTPAGDPLRTILGSYLQAAIRYYCADAWQKIGGYDADPCARFETNDPNDNTFVTSKLPCLALYRDDRNRKVVYLGNDVSYRECKLVALWIPPVAVQDNKAKRESFFNAIEAAIIAGLVRGRVPTWIVDGDTDASASYRGSHIGTQLRLMRPIHQGDIQFDDFELSIEMIAAPPRKYPGLRAMFTVWEQYVIDPSIGNVPAAIAPYSPGGYSLSVNGVPWNILQDPPAT
jgi:hypothetical protein